MLFKKNNAGFDWIIAGLGNPGKKYENTRHNIGFDALDYSAGKWGINIKKSKFDALYGEGIICGQKVILLKPQTFMNNSGISLQKASDYYNIPPQNIVVIFDDVSLNPGYLRIRNNGSAGGHNGIKSIIAGIGENFPRIKIGVGEKPHPDYELANWVLSRFAPKERKQIEERFDNIKDASELIICNKSSEAMSLHNGAKK